MSRDEYEGSIFVKTLGSWYQIDVQVGAFKVVEASAPTLRAACDMAAAGLADSLFRQIRFLMGAADTRKPPLCLHCSYSDGELYKQCGRDDCKEGEKIKEMQLRVDDVIPGNTCAICLRPSHPFKSCKEAEQCDASMLPEAPKGYRVERFDSAYSHRLSDYRGPVFRVLSHGTAGCFAEVSIDEAWRETVEEAWTGGQLSPFPGWPTETATEEDDNEI